jgi:hypothetical protein
MRGLVGRKQLLWLLLAGLTIALVAPAASIARKLHPAMLANAAYGPMPPSFARTADGTLHVVLETNVNWGDGWNGVGAVSISPAGSVGPETAAVNWNPGGGSPNGTPGLAVLGGALDAVFGGSPSGDDGPWSITSTDGGSSWSAPQDVGSGSMEGGDGNMTLQVSNGTPVFTAGCCGGIVVQSGFGPGAPTYQLVNNTDGAAGNTTTALDAATGAVIAGWDSVDGTGGLWAQQIAPSVGTAIKLPIPSQYGEGVPLILAGRDSGPGVFGAYPANFANTTKIRLQRYGGGSISVGRVRHLHADTWGVATGSDGRIWVMWWGQNTKTGKFELAVTRSNSADTAFEPIQTFPSTWTSLFTLSGDGRLGPLDLLIGGAPIAPGAKLGFYYARIVPALSATARAVGLGGGKFKLKVHVTDAGDPVSDATVSAKGTAKPANGSGRAKLKLRGHAGEHVTVTVHAPGYRVLKETVTL